MNESSGRRECFRSAIVIATVAALVLCGAPAEASGDVDADLAAYCRANYPNSVPQRIGLTHYCQQAGANGGATRQNIDYAAACRLTIGSETFRRDGSRVICIAEAVAVSTNAAAAGPPDFEAYCRKKFANSSYEKRAERWGVTHYCRLPGPTGGFTLQQINLAQACRLTWGISSFTDTDGNIVCSANAGRGVADLPPEPPPPAPPGPGPGPAPGPFPPGPIPGPQAFPQPLPGPLPVPFPVPATPGVAATGSPDERVANACHALGGQWHGQTLPDVEQILAQRDSALKEWLSGCGGNDPYCPDRVAIEQTMQAYFPIMMIWQCHVAFVGATTVGSLEEIRTARSEGCKIEEVLEKLENEADAHGATLESAQFREKSKLQWNIDDLCANGVVRISRTDGSLVDEDGPIPFLEPLFVEIEFDRNMKKPTRDVTIEFGEQGRLTLSADQVSGTIYRTSRPVIIAPSGVIESAAP
jgi:hypothetical protein